MFRLARVGDKDSRGNTIIEGSPNMKDQGLPVARVGDKLSDGSVITTGNPTIMVDGKPAAIVGSQVSNGNVIVSPCSSKVSTGFQIGTGAGSAIQPKQLQSAGFSADTTPETLTQSFTEAAKPAEQKEEEHAENWVRLELTDQDDKPAVNERYVIKDALSGSTVNSGTLDEQGKAFIPLPVPTQEVIVEYPDVSIEDLSELIRKPNEDDKAYASRTQDEINQALSNPDPEQRAAKLEQIHAALLSDQDISSPIDFANPSQGDIRWLMYTQGLKPSAWNHPQVPIMQKMDSPVQKDMFGEEWAMTHGGGASGVYVGHNHNMYDRGEALRLGLKRDPNVHSPQLAQLTYTKKLLAQYGPEAEMAAAKREGNVFGAAAGMAAGTIGLGGDKKGNGRGKTLRGKTATSDPLTQQDGTKKLIRGKYYTRKSDRKSSTKKRPSKIALQKKLKDARSSQIRATEAHKKLPRKYSQKTVASNGVQTLSGYKSTEKLPEGFARNESMQAEAMLKHSENLPGYKPTRTGANDPKGLPGGNAATHAEKQLARYHELNNIDRPIGVSREQCGDCRNWYRAQAQASNKEYVVADPKFTRIYKPNGQVEVYNQNNELVKIVNKNESSNANINNYENIPW